MDDEGLILARPHTALEVVYYVVSLVGFIPGARFDGKPWTQAVIEEGASERGTFTVIDTQALSPLDANPETPQARKFTTTKATRSSGWYRVTFKDAANNNQTSGAIFSPVQGQVSPAGNPSKLSARNTVRHQIRDGMPVGDAVPVPYNMVRLEPLTDQIPLEESAQVVFQVRYDLVPTQQHMTVQPVPGSLVAFVDGSWTPTTPTEDVDQNGNFTLPTAPTTQLLVTYAWQYLSDGEIDNFVERSREWLRAFPTLEAIPDGLTGALTQYAAALALRALARTATIANQRAGDTEISFGDLAKSYSAEADKLEARAEKDREQFYSRGPEPLEPFAEATVFAIDPYQPLR